MGSGKPLGTLIIIGGAEDKKGECTILKEFVRRAGGAKASIVVMTVATDHPDEVGMNYVDLFRRLGAGEATMVDVSQREDTHAAESLDAIVNATGIFFTGGDQLHITSLLGGADMDRILHERYQQGMILAGTSAGAAMMSNSMIIGGSAQETPRMEGVRMAPGMEFILGAAIDTHFSQRGRHGRLLTAVAHYPHDLGIGLDEDTAIIVEAETFEVIGSGTATVFDLGATSYTNLPDIQEDDTITLFDVKLHVLASGFRFDMVNRTPIMPQRAGDRKRKMKRAATHAVKARGTETGARRGTNDPTYARSTSGRIITIGDGAGASSGTDASAGGDGVGKAGAGKRAGSSGRSMAKTQPKARGSAKTGGRAAKPSASKGANAARKGSVAGNTKGGAGGTVKSAAKGAAKKAAKAADTKRSSSRAGSTTGSAKKGGRR